MNRKKSKNYVFENDILIYESHIHGFSDELFAEYLIILDNKKELTQERKENLQKLLNLRDNNSVQEEELVQFLNTYS